MKIGIIYLYLPTFTYIYHNNKIQPFMQPFMQVNIQNPNGMGPWYSLRPTSCSTLPGEGGICFHDFCVCVSFF